MDGQDEDQHFLSLELVVSMNQRAVMYIMNGDENTAAAVLREAVRLLASISPQGEGEFVPLLVGIPGLPHGLTLLNAQPTNAGPQYQDPPSLIVSVIDNGTFSELHGFGNAHRILVSVTLYNAAFTIHRRCCQRNSTDGVQLLRCRALCELCASAFTKVPELKPLKILLDAIVGHLYTMFEFPVAA
jgi:hypothetical protein